jgi:RNA polymerase sigma-70 factor, ECF subfamily
MRIEDREGRVSDDGARIRIQAMQLAISHQRMIQAYAFAIVRDFHLAEDVYQEVAVVIAGHGDTVPADGGFLPWLKEVIRRKALELRRKQARMRSQLSPEALAQVEAAFPHDRSDDLQEAMARCVDKLDGDAKRAIQARYRDGLDVPAIAGAIGRSVQGAYAVLKRARLSLEACVERTRTARA